MTVKGSIAPRERPIQPETRTRLGRELSRTALGYATLGARKVALNNSNERI